MLFQPTFESWGVDEEKWSFVVVAWYFEGTIDLRFSESLVTEQQFNFIANQLDQLLVTAIERLSMINMTVLRKLNSEHLKKRQQRFNE